MLDVPGPTDGEPWLDEEIVLEVARAWSIDPQQLDESMVDNRSAVWGVLP